MSESQEKVNSSVPTHLKDILKINENKCSEYNAEGKIQCTCGCKNVKLKFFAEAFKSYPEVIKALKGAELITLAVMDVITRNHEVREYLRSKNVYKKIKFLEPYVNSIIYTEIVHDACHDLKIMVLCPKNKKDSI